MDAEANVMANETRASRRAVAFDVARAYVDLRVAREELETIEATRGIVRQSIEASEVRYSSGRGSQQDALAGIVELSRLAREEVMVRERERMTRSRLNVLLGRASRQPPRRDRRDARRNVDPQAGTISNRGCGRRIPR